MGILFKVDKNIEDRPILSKKAFEDFYDFVDQNEKKSLPKSLLGKAFGYDQNQKKYLKIFLLDQRIELTNNRAERSIRPFVVGRRNWLFCNIPKGATSSAIIYSIIETAKENGLNPYKYLNFIFESIQNSEDEPRNLLPWSENLPKDVKTN